MYISADRTAWRARIDGTEPDVQRWHQVMQLMHEGASSLPALKQNQKGVALIGFASDEGVVRNLGRVGAAEGPQALRQFCAGLPVHFNQENTLLADLGTVYCKDSKLEEAQKTLGQHIAEAQAKGYKTLILGGGHEVAYGHWLGIRAGLAKGQTGGVINFDAHYDLRDLDGPRHSGNSFTAMAADCATDGRPFAYAALGIQRTGNTRRLFERAQALGVLTLLAEDVENQALLGDNSPLSGFLNMHKPQMLTIDLDVFAASVAPGVSAPTALGIQPSPSFTRLLRQILASPSVRSVDIAELNPRYDVDHRTARLGAALAFEVVQAWVG